MGFFLPLIDKTGGTELRDAYDDSAAEEALA